MLVLTEHFSASYIYFWFVLLGKFKMYTLKQTEKRWMQQISRPHTVSCGNDFLLSLQS